MKKYIIILSFFCLNITSCAHSQEANDIRVVVLSSLERVLQDDIDVNGTRSAEVYCAKNEYESFQIIVINPTNEPVTQVDLNAGNWHFTGTPGKNSPELTLYREHYVKIASPSPRAKSKAGMYPDALVPFVNPYTDERIVSAKYLASGQDVKAGQNQGYWIDISADRDTTAGVYKNEITVFSGNKSIAVIPVTVTVWDFALPENHKLKAYFSSMRDVSSYHHISKDSPKYKLIEERYLLLLRDHGVRCRFEIPPTESTGHAIFSTKYVEKLRRFTLETKPSVTLVALQFKNDPVKRRNYLLSWEDFLQRNPWLPEPITYFDEPRTKSDYLAVIEYSKAIRKYAPSVKSFVAAPVRPGQPDLPSLDDSVDIFAPPWYWANPEQIKNWQALGHEAWSYIHGDNKGIPNWLIEFSLLDYRIPEWFAWSLDLKGILYWQTAAWSKETVKIDPWVNCSTYPKANFSCGEGSLIYPGAAAGIDGPVASMRLKVFRDGVEDFDYFWILSELIGRDATTKIVSPVASSFRVYSNDPNKYIETRKIIAQKIQQNLKN
jgi:hypothetical protein